MASTDSDEHVGSARVRRFTTRPPSIDALATADGGVTRPLLSLRAGIAAVVLGAAAVACLLLATGAGPESDTTVDVAASQRVFSIKELTRLAEMKADALPDGKTTVRGLVTAQAFAADVARFQNDYRHLTPEVSAAGGQLDGALTLATRRNLIPYFALDVDPSMREPWYLLTGDKDVTEGVGIPLGFDSGFEWVAQQPLTVNDDGTIPVTWLAVETKAALRDDQPPVVLAWTHADYDITRKTFSNVAHGTTAVGETQRLEVVVP